MLWHAVFACIVSTAVAQYNAISIIVGTSSYDPGIRGWVKFSQPDASSPVTVTAFLTNITVNPNAAHGLHIHTFGDVSGPAGLATGAHFNPFSKPHGCPETNGTDRHVGDMGNWQVVDGVLNETKTLDLLTLTGPNSILGRGVIFHQNPDDCVTLNTGNAGNRLAQGVIGLDENGVANNTANITRATCFYNSAYGVVDGQVWITDDAWAGDASGASIRGQFNGIGGDNHAYHIHKWSDISNLTATGTHYNPYNSPAHGVPPYPIRDAGDLGNIYYTNGTATRYYAFDSNSLVHLNYNGSNVLGRAMVVHALADNCTTNWGARIAGCVIGIADPTSFPVSPIPAGVPTAQPNAAMCAPSTTGAAPAPSTGTTSTTTSTSTTSTGTTSTGTTSTGTTSTGTTSTGTTASPTSSSSTTSQDASSSTTIAVSALTILAMAVLSIVC
eukprot:TRINITY_DN1487_c0_g1_i1.p1 TRINITY_DN1487_c0_g1~~TRINITY_DN1487_c0_g1_i1.p1  ORF type:complete len:442 (-),score=161.05 TRINITY_DN1487_c0_g1_i1:217-1542(-)